MMISDMAKSDSDTIQDAYGATIEKLFANLFEGYAHHHAPAPEADKRFAAGVKLARQARDNAISIVSAP